MWLGIDLGTSSVKVIVIGADGSTLTRQEHSYPTDTRPGSRVEQDPRDWIIAIREAIGGLSDSERASIRGIGVDGHVPSLLALDAAREPVRPCIIWQDARADAQATRLADSIGDAETAIGIRLPWHATQLPAKAAWLATHEPESAARTRWLVSPKDYLNLYLTGEIASDPWTMKGLCNVRTTQPASSVLSAGGWSDDVIPALREPDGPLGALRPDAATELGLPPGIPVAVGWTDAMTAMLASGVFQSPTGMVLTGTSDIVGASAASAQETPELYLVPATIAPLALSYGPTSLSGGSLVWVADLLGLTIPDALALATRAGDATPTFLPYLAGERAPLWSTSVRGVFLGLREEHGRPEIVRSVIEGIALSSWHVLSIALAKGTGTQVDEVQFGGRGFDDPLLLAARSGALGLPLRLHREPYLSALGAAMLAACAAGEPLSNRSSGVQTALHLPDPAQQDYWQAKRDAYAAAVEVALAWDDRYR